MARSIARQPVKRSSADSLSEEEEEAFFGVGQALQAQKRTLSRMVEKTAQLGGGGATFFKEKADSLHVTDKKQATFQKIVEGLWMIFVLVYKPSFHSK